MDSNLFGVRKTVLSELACDDIRRGDNPAATHLMTCTNLDLCNITNPNTCKCIGTEE